eukprot:COSAG01_NODE_198_length_22280_cov_21.529775_27_plen_78_part_00
MKKQRLLQNLSLSQIGFLADRGARAAAAPALTCREWQPSAEARYGPSTDQPPRPPPRCIGAATPRAPAHQRRDPRCA